MKFYYRKEGLFFLFLSLTAFAGVIEQEITFEKNDISFTKIEKYDFIRLKGCESNEEIGAPSLPRASFSLLIPQGSEVTRVEVISLDKEIIPGEYEVYPTQHPQPFIKGKIFEFVEPDKDIYAQDTPYPEKIIEFSHTGSMGGYKLANLLAYPIQYIPKEKQLIFYSKIEFRVTYEENLRSLNIKKTEKQNEIFGERVRKLVLNPEDIGISKPSIGLDKSRALPADTVEYVIITASTLREPFEELAKWKTKKGIPAQVVTLDYIYANYSGVDNADRVRNFIKDANSSWGTIWVLLGGQCDYEWGQEIVPRRNVWYITSYGGNYPDEDTIPSDLYFSDLDGNWNADGDGVYGESTDGVDFYSDVFVGRAPVRTLTQAEIFVNKVLTYEKNPPSDYLKKILLPAAYLWPSIYDERISQEAIANIVPSDWQITKMYERNGNLIHSTFIDSVRAGFGFAHLVGHGNEEGVYTYYADAYINSDDMDALNNGDLLGIHNSIACMAGGLDLVLYGDCFAEHYLTPSTGGSFSIMNSRYGWGQPPNMGPSEHIDTCFYHEIFKGDYLYHDHLGVAHAFSKDGYVSQITWGGVWPWCIYELNLFGDPEMPLWTDTPGELTVTHDAVIPVGGSSFVVNVTDGSSGVEDAFVCLYKEGEVYERGYTDASGSIILTLEPPPASLGTMYCTVTKSNYLPYEDSIAVISPSGPWVIFDSYSVTEISGNGDGNVDPGENIELALTVHNVGLDSAYSIRGILRTTDSYVTITDSTKDFGDIPPDSLAVGLEDFDFEVASSCPANHIINFVLAASDINDSLWISNFSIPISTPDIAVSADTLNFDTVFIGYSDTFELQVNNTGRDTLFVSNIISNNTEFSVDITNFDVPPAESQTVRVIFAPLAEIVSTGTLTINSNDLDEPNAVVFLLGEGLLPPNISVSPDSLSDSLYTGETSTHILKIYNNGASDLDFDISIMELTSTTKSQNISFRVTDFKNNKNAIPEENSGTVNEFGTEFSKRIYESDASPSALEHILVMERGPGSYYYDIALGNLGLPRTLVTSWDEFYAELTSGTQWELIIVNSYGNIPSDEILLLLDDYQANGGVLIYADWALYSYATHPFLTSLGISFVSDFTTPINFYAVNPGHPIFNNPNDIDSLYWTDNQYIRDGEIVNVLAGATQLAYFEGYPDNGAIVLNSKGNCLFNAFQSMNFNSDDDSDGKLDIVELIENEIKYLSMCWISFDIKSGTIPSADSVLVEITFDATNLYGGDYFADIIITSNDPDEPEVTVPAHLHVTGAPDITVSEDTLDYGIVFDGYSANDTLIIGNVGTDLLTVNNISSDNPDFTVDLTNFTLDPDKKQNIAVILTPSSLGTITGTLTINCDDPDEPTVYVFLQGECLEPPDISVSPGSLRDSLFTGETATHTLTIYNTGLSELIFDISIEKGSEGEPLVSLNTRISPEDKKISTTGLQKSIIGEPAAINQPNSPVRLYKSSKTRGMRDIAILGPDGSGSNLYLDDIAQYLINSGQFSSVTTINGTMVTPTLAELQTFDAIGAFGWFGWNDADAVGDVLADYVDAGGDLFIAFAANGTGGDWMIEGRFNTENYWLISPYNYNGGVSYHMGNIYEPGHPIMAGVNTLTSGSKLNSGASVSPGATLLAEFLDGTPLAVINKVGDSRRIDISFPFFTSAASSWGIDTTSDAKLLITNAFDWVTGPDWLSENPTSDTILPGDSIEIEITFDATGLYGGDYSSNIIIASNDPDEPEVTVPAYLHITGAPDISISEDTLDYGIVFPDFSATDTLIFSNIGTDSLIVNNIFTDNPDYTVDTTNFILYPEESQIVLVTFTPSTMGTITGTLTIESDDPDEPIINIPMQGECLEPPDISVSPDFLTDSLFNDETAIHVLTIYNTGFSNLNFDISIYGADSFLVEPAKSKEPCSPPSFVQKPLKPEETAAGVTNNFVASTTIEFAYSDIFEDDFEDGDYDGWLDGGGYGTKEVTNATAAKGTVYSYHEYDSPSSHYNGIYRLLGAAQPGYVSFYIRSGSTTTHDGYFVLRNSSGDEVIFFFARGEGRFYVNADVGGDETYVYTAETWYHIEFKNINFITKTFDYYINGVLIKAGIYFRNASFTEDITRLDLYNFSEGSQAWWDEILISTEEFPAWIMADTTSGAVPAGDSLQIEILLDPTGMNVGNYYADIIIYSNDPDEPEVTVPVHLYVRSGSGIEEVKIPKVFSIKQNYPNPFNRQTVIRYGCPKRSTVVIQIFDIMGRLVATLVNKEVEAGYHEAIWNGCTNEGKKVANSVYFYRMQTEENCTPIKKMVLLQ
jgi:hypothetical protein